MPPLHARLLDKVKAALWKAIRSDKVRPFVWVYYIALWVWGIYGTFFAGPATYVAPVMGGLAYDVWIWLNVAGTTVVMCGLYLEDKSGTPRTLETALRLQVGGHAAMFWVLLAYEVAAIAATSWGQGTYSIFVIAPYVGGCLLLTAQGLVRLLTLNKGEGP